MHAEYGCPTQCFIVFLEMELPLAIPKTSPQPPKKKPEVPRLDHEEQAEDNLGDMCEMTIWEAGKTQYVRSAL